MNLTEAARIRLWLGVIVLLALGLRIYHLALFPLWRDEAFTRFFAGQPLSYLWTTGFRLESNPPGFYTLVHGWMLLFGASEVALRSISVIASTVAVLIVYALGKTVVNARVGLIGALIFALCPSEIWYAQEARTYAVVQVLVGLMLLGLARFLVRPAAVAPLVIYAVSALAAVYCHDTVLFVVAACNFAVLGAAWGPHALLTVRDITRWIIVNAVLGVTLLPTVWMTLHQVKTSNISWIPPLSFHSLAACFSELLGGEAAVVESLNAHPWILLVVLGAALCRPGVLDRRRLTVLVLVPAFFVALAILLSLHQSMIIPRVFLWMWIPLSVLLGVSMERAGVLRWAVLAVTIAIFGVGLKAHYFSHGTLKEDWRDLSALEPGIGSPSTLIVLNSRVSVGPLAYYHPEVLPRVRFLHDEAAPPEFMEVFLGETLHIPEIDAEGLRSAIASSQPVYLLTKEDKNVEANSPANLPVPSGQGKVALGTLPLHVSTWNPAPPN